MRMRLRLRLRSTLNRPNINADGKTTEDAFEDDKEEASRNSDMEDKFSDMEDESKGNEEDLEFEF